MGYLLFLWYITVKLYWKETLWKEKYYAVPYSLEVEYIDKERFSIAIFMQYNVEQISSGKVGNHVSRGCLLHIIVYEYIISRKSVLDNEIHPHSEFKSVVCFFSKFFKSGDLHSAINAYSTAIRFNPKLHSYPFLSCLTIHFFLIRYVYITLYSTQHRIQMRFLP